MLSILRFPVVRLQILVLLCLLILSFYAQNVQQHLPFTVKTGHASVNVNHTPLSTFSQGQGLKLIPSGFIPGLVTSAAISDTKVYIGFPDAIRTFDITNRATPQLQSTFPLSYPLTAIAVYGQRVYTTYSYSFTSCCVSGVLDILDVEDATNPRLLQRLDVIPATEVYVADQRVYLPVDEVRPYQTRLSIIDLVTAESGEYKGSEPDSGGGGPLALKGNIAYLGTVDGLEIIDISDIRNPMRRGIVSGIQHATAIRVFGDRAYVADETQGLLIFDIRVPESPTLIGQIATQATPTSLSVQDNLVYVALGEQGIEVINVTDPSLPQRVTVYMTATPATSVVVQGGWVYVLSRDHGLYIFLTAAERISLPLIYR